LKVTSKNNINHPLEYHVGDVIESMEDTIAYPDYHKKHFGKAHYLVCVVGTNYGLLYLENDSITTYDNTRLFIENTLEELYNKANDPTDILVDAELVIK